MLAYKATREGRCNLSFAHTVERINYDYRPINSDTACQRHLRCFRLDEQLRDYIYHEIPLYDIKIDAIVSCNSQTLGVKMGYANDESVWHAVGFSGSSYHLIEIDPSLGERLDALLEIYKEKYPDR
jgi:hypothetical protein